MKAGELSSICKIVGRISNPSSITSLYKSIEIGTDSVRACSEFGNIKITIENTGLKNSCLLDHGALSAVCSSLPSSSEVEFDEKSNKLNWKCGQAKGTLNFVTSDHSIPDITHTNFPWTPQQKLGDALLLASSACQAAAVPFGLYGIVIEPDNDKLRLLSSNSISLAASSVEKGDYPFQKITIRPPVPQIISALIDTCPNCKLDVTKDGIFIEGDWLKAHLPLGSNLEHDLKGIYDKFTGETTTTTIDNAAVKKFINRAKLLSDKNVSFTVNLKIEKGQLILSHSGISSSTEEYFLASGLDEGITYESVALPADMLALPIQFTSKAVLDFLPNKQLVLKGENPEFTYVLGGEN